MKPIVAIVATIMTPMMTAPTTALHLPRDSYPDCKVRSKPAEE